MLEWFLRVGHRVFSHDSWHRVPFQPVLYFFLWGATVRVFITERNAPIRFELLTVYAERTWLALGLLCPPLTLLAWWLIRRCQKHWSTLVGMWMRMIGDLGQFIVLVVYHILMVAYPHIIEVPDGEIFFRYLTGSCLVFVFLLFVRDVWALVLTERVAGAIYTLDTPKEPSDA